MGVNHSSKDLSLPGCATVLAYAGPVVPDIALEHRAFIFKVKQCKNRPNVPENEGPIVLLNARNQPNNTAYNPSRHKSSATSIQQQTDSWSSHLDCIQFLWWQCWTEQGLCFVLQDTKTNSHYSMVCSIPSAIRTLHHHLRFWHILPFNACHFFFVFYISINRYCQLLTRILVLKRVIKLSRHVCVWISWRLSLFHILYINAHANYQILAIWPVQLR